MNCPLCQSTECSHFHYNKNGDRDFFRCSNCNLRFSDPNKLLSSTEEKDQYDRHNNDIYDSGYRQFLSKVFDPVCEQKGTDSIGLEFGCGPGPALATMFKEAGYAIDLYDLYYHPDDSVFSKKYDFITTTEVFEHLYNPTEVLETLLSLLKSDGILVIMTQFALSDEAFKTWWYINDPTHVIFFSTETFEWLAAKYNLELTQASKSVIIIKKKYRVKATY